MVTFGIATAAIEVTYPRMPGYQGGPGVTWGKGITRAKLLAEIPALSILIAFSRGLS